MVWNYGDSSDEEERTDRFKSERSTQRADNSTNKNIGSLGSSNDKDYSKDKNRDRRRNDIRRKRSRSRSAHRKLDERDRRLDSRDRSRQDSHDRLRHESRERPRHASGERSRHEVRDRSRYESHEVLRYEAYERRSERHILGDRFREESRVTARHESYEARHNYDILGNDPVRWSSERSSQEYYSNIDVSSSKSKEEKHSKHSRDKKNSETKQSNSDGKRSSSTDRRSGSETKKSKHHSSSGSPKLKVPTSKSDVRSIKPVPEIRNKPDSSEVTSKESKVSATKEPVTEKVVKIKKCKRKAKLREKESIENEEALKLAENEKAKNENSVAEKKVPAKTVVTKIISKKENSTSSESTLPKTVVAKKTVIVKKAVPGTTQSKKGSTEKAGKSLTQSSDVIKKASAQKVVPKKSIVATKKAQGTVPTKKPQIVEVAKKTTQNVDSTVNPLPQNIDSNNETSNSLPVVEDIKTDLKPTKLEDGPITDDASTFLCKSISETGDTKIERVYGPSLPVRPSVDPAESYGPALPPSMSTQSDSPGGSPSPSLSPGQRDGSPESDDGVFGPVLPGSALDPAQIALQHRATLLQMHHAQESDNGKERVEREEWMTKLPDRGQAVGLGLTARTFKARESDAQRDESWTDTPEEKERKQLLAQAGVVDTSKKKSKETDVMIKQRDEAMEKMAKKHKKDRNKSLLEMHQDKLKKAKQTDAKPERRPFSRETDLNVNQLSDAQKKTIYKKAAALDSRFSSGQAKFL